MVIIAGRFSLLVIVLCGLIYPLTVTALAQGLFPVQANGSLLHTVQGSLRGSALIGQSFSQPQYFHPRLSANNYDAANSGGSNLGATQAKLIDRIKADALTYQQQEQSETVPMDAVTTSASGLDPMISLANARIQQVRVARERHRSVAEIEHLIQLSTVNPFLAGTGESVVNVVLLNQALDHASAP